MLLIIGLGNPGKKYSHTRHNAGFLAMDEIRKTWGFPEFEFNKKFNAETSQGTYNLQPTTYNLLLVKPQTFMNKSGEAVKSILTFYKLTPDDIIVIHDDLDLEIGKYKISEKSSAAGHNGVQDIIDKLGTQNFKRIRIGVETEGGRANRIIPGDLSSGTLVKGEDFVLQDFTKEEMGKIKNIVNDVLNEIKKLL